MIKIKICINPLEIYMYKGIDLQIDKGEIRHSRSSGSGKSTVLRCMNLLKANKKEK